MRGRSAPQWFTGKRCIFVMTFRLRRITPLVLALSLLAALVVAPAVARADSLSWTLRYSGPANIKDYPNPDIPVAGAFNAVSFSDQMTGWAVGARIDNVNPQSLPLPKSFVAVTHDGGQNWGPVTSVTNANQMWAVDAVSATDAWAVGAAGTVMHWNGSEWRPSQPLGTAWATKSLRGVAFVDTLHGWVVGDAGAAYTSNGGASWTNITAPVLNAISVVDGTTAVAVGNSGAIRRLVGAETPVLLPSGTSQNLNGVAFSEDGQRGIAVGANATARLTLDGGTTWTPVSLLLPQGFIASQITARAVAFAGPNETIITGTYQTVWRSFDGGSTWATERLSDGTSNGDFDLRGAAFVGGSPDVPFTVGRAYNSQLTSSDHKARAYLGSWSGRVLPPPTPPTAVTTQRATPGPRIRVSWTDGSSNEDGFVIQRAQDSNVDGAFVTVATVATDTTSWTDTSADWSSTWYYRVRSYRGDLSSTWAVSGGFIVDTLAPTTSSNAESAYILQASIHLTAQDEADGSGVARTFYTIDTTSRSGAHQGTDFVVTGLGQHTIRFWSEDRAGNVENPGGAFTFSINPTPADPDNQAPVTTTDISGSHEGSVTVTLDATDVGGSGVATTWYAFNGGSPVRYTIPFPVSSPHEYTMEFWSVDAATPANTEARNIATFTVTASAPPTTTPSSPVQTYYLNSARISVTATDGPFGSGVATTYMSVDGAAETETTSVAVTGYSKHTVSFRSVDELGNAEATTTVTFTIAPTPSSKGTPSTLSQIPTVPHGTSFFVYGFMKRYSHTYSARLYFYRYKSEKWVYYRYVTAKSATALTFLRYSASTSVPYVGRWKVRARRVVGSTVRYSPYEYFDAS